MSILFWMNLFCFVLFETWSLHVAQIHLKFFLLRFLSAGVIGVNHHSWLTHTLEPALVIACQKRPAYMTSRSHVLWSHSAVSSNWHMLRLDNVASVWVISNYFCNMVKINKYTNKQSQNGISVGGAILLAAESKFELVLAETYTSSMINLSGSPFNQAINPRSSVTETGKEFMAKFFTS